MTSQSTLSVAALLKTVPERRHVRVIGEMTPEAFRVLREKDRSFADAFHVIRISELSADDNLRVLFSEQRRLETRHRCRFSIESLPAVIDLQRRYARDVAFPGKAANFLKRLAVRIEGEAQPDASSDKAGTPAVISRERVLDAFHQQTGLPRSFLDQQQTLASDHVAQKPRERFVGQPDAVKAAVEIIAIARARLNDPTRPIASLLLLGPTGVGKTEFAKSLAAYLFGHADRLLRFDMNEYVSPNAVPQLVGTFAQPEGLLTAAVRRQPFAMILFDEIEKGHPDVFDLLLQVLGEGRLTDARGRTTDFSNTIIVLTSNLGTQRSESGLGFGKALTKEGVLQTFLQRTGLPDRFLRDNLPLSREQLISEFQSQIMGQPLACETAADIIVKFKAGMNDPGRPLGVLLFCGPKGVGKTELARAVSRCLFGGKSGNEDGANSATESSEKSARMIRLDMSEYSGPWAADRLLMQSNGEPSDFLQQIRRQPFTVLLLDEIEKAHPSVYDVLMNVFDEGRLTDRFGRTTWFRSTVILLTSNPGSDSSGQVGFADSVATPNMRHEAAVREFFRPEFFNRLDGVVTFDALTRAAILQFTEKELQEIAGREGLRKLGLRLQWKKDVVEHLSKAGFDPRYGARPVQRTLETHVVAPLSRFLTERHDLRSKSIELKLCSAGETEFKIL